MENLVDLKEDGFDHIMADELEVRFPDQMCDVFLATSEEIIQTNDLIAVLRNLSVSRSLV